MIRIKLKKSQPLKLRKRLKTKARLRKRISGTNGRPRFCVFKSQKHIYAQVINDSAGKTLVSFSSLKLEKGSSVETARQVGEKVAELALAKKVNQVVFDRSGFIYYGRVKALAEGARAKGLQF